MLYVQIQIRLICFYEHIAISILSTLCTNIQDNIWKLSTLTMVGVAAINYEGLHAFVQD